MTIRVFCRHCRRHGTVTLRRGEISHVLHDGDPTDCIVPTDCLVASTVPEPYVPPCCVEPSDGADLVDLVDLRQ